MHLHTSRNIIFLFNPCQCTSSSLSLAVHSSALTVFYYSLFLSLFVLPLHTSANSTAESLRSGIRLSFVTPWTKMNTVTLLDYVLAQLFCFPCYITPFGTRRDNKGGVESGTVRERKDERKEIGETYGREKLYRVSLLCSWICLSPSLGFCSPFLCCPECLSPLFIRMRDNGFGFCAAKVPTSSVNPFCLRTCGREACACSPGI